MRISTSKRVLIASFLGIGVALSATTILAQQSKPRPKAKPVVPITITNVFTQLTAEEAEKAMERTPAEQARAMKSLVASYQIENLRIQVVDGRMTVSTTADLYDLKPETRFMWALEVLDESGRTKFVDKPYLDQIFSIEPSKFAAPTFVDSVDLLPGEYTVHVLMYHFGPDVDPTTLGGPQAPAMTQPCGKNAKVTVGRAQQIRPR